ncbi:hypothetical protein SH661x_002496 [Planctomicrobium sp. SH661]|uniref:hypothetical protein n=1 Tax=Planctomicrobium sp. SH661 TaxID=3448124 RepID=UPI003F5B2266
MRTNQTETCEPIDGLPHCTASNRQSLADEPNGQGTHLETKWLSEKVTEVKELFPVMPGIGFYQSAAPDSPALRQLIRHCDFLSRRHWP